MLMEFGAKSNPLLIRGSCQRSRQQVWPARAARRNGVFPGRELNRLRRQIHRPADSECDMGDRVQLNDEIHVAIGDGFATGNRPAQ